MSMYIRCGSTDFRCRSGLVDMVDVNLAAMGLCLWFVDYVGQIHEAHAGLIDDSLIY